MKKQGITRPLQSFFDKKFSTILTSGFVENHLVGVSHIADKTAFYTSLAFYLRQDLIAYHISHLNTL